MQNLPELAFATRRPEPPALEIRVNFGIFAGRQATPAEIDELAKVLLPEVGEVSIVAEERHEIDQDVAAAVQQVRIEVAGELLPLDENEVDALRDRLVAAAEQWAEACIAERHSDIADL